MIMTIKDANDRLKYIENLIKNAEHLLNLSKDCEFKDEIEYIESHTPMNLTIATLLEDTIPILKNEVVRMKSIIEDTQVEF